VVQGLTKVSIGQSMGDGFPAHTYNAMVEVINAYRRGQLTNLGVAGDTVRSAGIVHVKNNSGAARTRMGVLGIGAPLILPSADLLEFKDRVRVNGDTPAAAHVPDLFVILREPIDADKVGLATIAGVCQVEINVTDVNHGFAGCEENNYTTLVSRTFGGARILWKETGLGTKRAIVRLGPPPEIGIVEITGTACEETERNATTCLWPGSLLTLDTASGTCAPWGIGEDVWILELNVCDTQGAKAFKKIRGGERFVAARLGTYDNGGDVRELYALRNPDIGKVRVNTNDDLDFLEDQYRDQVAGDTYATGDLLVKSQTDVVAGDQLIRRFVDASGYSSNEQVLTHPAGSPTPTWVDLVELTVVTDTRLYNSALQKQTKTFKAIGPVVDNGWSEAYPSTECG